MARSQIGQIDSDLLAEVNARAKALGQTRRMYVERALRSAMEAADAEAMTLAELRARMFPTPTEGGDR